jgi:hypothetical protein
MLAHAVLVRMDCHEEWVVFAFLLIFAVAVEREACTLFVFDLSSELLIVFVDGISKPIRPTMFKLPILVQFLLNVFHVFVGSLAYVNPQTRRENKLL